RTGGGAPTQNISEKPEPPVGAPASGANASRRWRSCRQTRFAPGAVLLHETYRRSPSPLSEHPPRVRMPAGGGGVVGKPVSHRGRCSYTKHIGEARAHCRSTRPGCECQPAAAELSANPCRTGRGAPTQNISEKPEPTVGAPAPGANVSRRRRGCRQTRFAPKAVLLHGVWPGYTGCSRGRRLTP